MSLPVLLVCDDVPRREEIQELIVGEKSLALVKTVSSNDARKTIEKLNPQLVWIELLPAPVLGLSLLAELRKCFPQIAFLLSYHKLDAELMRTAYRLRAAEFLDSNSWKTELATAIKRVESKLQLEDHLVRNATLSTNATDQSRPLSTLLVCEASNEKRNAIETLIKTQKQLTLTATVPTSSALEKARSEQPNLIWIELGPNTERALSLLAELKNNFPQMNVFVSYDVLDPALVSASFRLGASDFFDAERWKIDLRAAIENLQPNKRSKLSVLLPLLLLIILAALGYWFLYERH